MLSRGRQNVCKGFWHRLLPRFLKKLLESEILVCNAMARMKTSLGIIQLMVHLSRGVFFQSTSQRKYYLFENSRKASRAAQNALAGRVFEIPDLNLP